MTFRILEMHKNIDTYTVSNNLRETMMVSGYQIIGAMLQGHEFENARLTKKGFAIVTDKGTRYVQLRLDRNTSILIEQKLENDRLAEEAKKQQMARAIKKPVVSNNRQSINNNKNTQAIVFRGDRYVSDTQLCKKYNRDINTFRSLVKKGYSISELNNVYTGNDILDLILSQKKAD